MAPNLSVTFSQPMVPITSHAVAVKTLPVTLEPAVKGNWRWVGTRTLLFEPGERFAQATRYHATVAVGTASMTGGKLVQPFSFDFETPAPRVLAAYPTGTTGLDPMMLVIFDQKVDPATVVAVSGGGSGTGIAALINGTVDIANSSRELQLA